MHCHFVAPTNNGGRKFSSPASDRSMLFLSVKRCSANVLPKPISGLQHAARVRHNASSLIPLITPVSALAGDAGYGTAASGTFVTDKTLTQSIKDFIKLARLKFLPSSGMLVLLGAIAGGPMSTGMFDVGRFATTIGIVWIMHVATHFTSEYYDYEADAKNMTFTKWSGGSRVLVNGSVPRHMALLAGVVLFLTAAAINAHAVLMHGVPTESLAWLLINGFLCWGYTAPPFRFQYNSMGELVVAVVLAILTPAFGFMFQSGQQHTAAIWQAVPELLIVQGILFLQFWARMLVQNMPDVNGDVAVGKVTFTARVGIQPASIIFTGIQVICTSAAVVGWLVGKLPIDLMCAVLVPMSLGFSIVPALLSMGKKWKVNDTTAGLPFKATMHVYATCLAVVLCMLQRAFP